MTIEELECGLRTLDADGLDRIGFWDEHVSAFKQTLLIAVRDTSDALLRVEMPAEWRAELESQLKALLGYLELTDRYLANRRRQAPQQHAWPIDKSMMN